MASFVRGTVHTDPAVVTSGTLDTGNPTLTITDLGGHPVDLTAYLPLGVFWDGTLTFEGTVDGTNWRVLGYWDPFSPALGEQFSVTYGSAYTLHLPIIGYQSIRAVLSGNTEGSQDVTFRISPSPFLIRTNHIGRQTVNIGTIAGGNIVKVDLSAFAQLINGRVAEDYYGLAVREVAMSCLPASGTASSSGDNTILTPASGNKLRIFYLSYNPTSSCTCAFRFGAGSLFLKNTLVAGSVVAKDFGDTRFIEGATDESLILNLSSAVSTVWNVFYVETT